MTTILQFLIQSIPIFIFIGVPGFLLALALLRKTKLHLFEIFFVGIVLGASVPSFMAFIESLLGISFSLALHLVNLTIICIGSIAVMIKDKVEILPKTKLEIKTLYPFLTLFVILFLAWWIRTQSLSPYFYEFDPYWYNTITEFIIKQGDIPVHSDNAWWPQAYSYRGMIIVPYAEAGWYHIYTVMNGINQFDFTTMTLVSSLYPPLAAMLMCFFAYLWLSREYGKAIGILAAGLLAFTPVLVDKTLAGEFEMQPWGLFAIIFFLAFYALSLKTNSKRFALIAALAIIIGYLGSGAGRLPIYLLIGISSALAILKFIKNELKMDFVYTNIIITAGAVIGIGLNIIFFLPLGSMPGLSVLAMCLVFLAFIGLLIYLQPTSKTIEEKIFYLSSIFVVGLVLVLIGPLGGIVSEVTNLFVGVVSYTDPTFQTIAEQIVTGSSLHSALGLFGVDISDFSIVPIVIAVCAILIGLSLFFEPGIYTILGLFAVLPLSLTGLVKIKYAPYSGLFVPLLFCFALGEMRKYKRFEKYKLYILGFGILALFVQAIYYYDIVLSSFPDPLQLSIGIAGSVDITNNIEITKVCNEKYQELNTIGGSSNLPLVKDIILGSKYITQRIYCNRIPDHWLNAMFWLRDNTALEERTFCWWDYGHWITTFGQRKSVTDNTHAFTIMHQEVADKIVYNTPEALIQYIKEHKAKYLLLDQDLIGKWGALVYHACYYNNKTKIETGPGGSDCDRDYSPEFVFVPLQLSSDNLCSGTTNEQRSVKVYSPYFGRKNQFNYYCSSIDSLNEELSLLQSGTSYIPLSFTYENGKSTGITNGIFQGRSSDENYLIFLVTYPSNNLDRKGKFYDSVFYKGFFEGKIPGFKQVHPINNIQGPNLPVRIFELIN